MLGDLRPGSVDGLVADDDGLEVVSSVVDSLDELGCEQHIGNLSALTHDSNPDRQLGVVARASQRQVVALVAHALHDILVYNCEDEAIERAVGDLLRVGLAVRRREFGLPAIEDVSGSLETLARCRETFEEQGKHALSQPHEGVGALVEAQLEVDESNVLASGRVCLVLVGLLLLEHAVHICNRSLSVWARVADLGKLLGQDRGVSLHPCLGLAAIALGAPEVNRDESDEEGQDVHLQLEVVHGGALPYPVPCCVGSVVTETCRSGLRCTGTGREGRDGSGCGLRSTCVVGEVCLLSAQAIGLYVDRLCDIRWHPHDNLANSSPVKEFEHRKGVSCGPASQAGGLAIAHAMQCTYHHHRQLGPVQAFAHRRDP